MTRRGLRRPRTSGEPSLRRYGRLLLASVLPAGVIAAVLLSTVAGAALAPHSAGAQDLLLGATGPGGDHPLGTDDLGRDVLSRLIVGARTAVVGPAVIAFASMLLGGAIGLVAGFRGGLTATVIMRVSDLVYALPGMLVAIVVAGVVGGGYWVAVGVLIVLFSPYAARLVRAAVLEQCSRPYVEAARLLGTSGTRIMLRELLPNVRGIALANAFLSFAYALVGLSALSFLGIGVGSGTPDWGRMLAESRSYLDLNAWAAVAPGIALSVLAGTVTLLGDRLEERMDDRGRAR